MRDYLRMVGEVNDSQAYVEEYRIWMDADGYVCQWGHCGTQAGCFWTYDEPKPITLAERALIYKVM